MVLLAEYLSVKTNQGWLKLEPQEYSRVSRHVNL